MKSVLAAAAAVALTLSAPAAMAANARNPYGNVDHSNDAGNGTGDSQVDQLNNAQLDQNYTGPRYTLPPPGSTPSAPPPGSMPYADSAQGDTGATPAQRPMRRRAVRRAAQPAASTSQ